jgi:GntR family transcriptional regulator, transcriptional repressor for pyruvate dehydrogenase complex
MTIEAISALRVPPERRRYERVVDRLLELIEARGLGPGDSMPTERELAALFGVSRNVLRQAFGILEERGLLTTLRGSGRYLRDADATEDTQGGRARVEIASIADVLEARTLLEVQIAELACQRRTSDEAQNLIVLSRRLTSWEDNVAFHCAIAACTHNFMLERMVRQQVDLSRELHQRDYYDDPDQLDRMRLEHQTIANAIAARDVTAAKELVRGHLTRTSKLLLHQPEVDEP